MKLWLHELTADQTMGYDYLGYFPCDRKPSFAPVLLLWLEGKEHYAWLMMTYTSSHDALDHETGVSTL